MLQNDVPTDYGYLTFSCLNDDVWNEYILDDKSIIKIKTVLLKVRDLGQDEQSINETNLIVTFSPPGLRGTPSNDKISIKDLSRAEDTVDIGFKTKVEEWVEYELENGMKIHAKPVMISASRTAKFDSYGEPIYLIQTQTLHKIIPKKVKKSNEI